MVRLKQDRYYFASLTDRELNNTINALLELRCDRKKGDASKLEAMAMLEWQDRYPDTIPPCIRDRAMRKGGFPECYKGPKDTVDITE